LGAFTFRVVVAGTVRPADRRKPGDGDDVGHQVSINDVGIYIRDSYDFEGDQFLGYWDTGSTYLRPWGAVDSPQAAKRMKYGKVSLSYFQGGERIENADFRKWRMQTGKGGDFLVFSNLKRFTPPGSATFNTWAHWERFH
jgi:hypothetical protein